VEGRGKGGVEVDSGPALVTVESCWLKDFTKYDEPTDNQSQIKQPLDRSCQRFTEQTTAVAAGLGSTVSHLCLHDQIIVTAAGLGP
jgi:hypothetical protein